MVNIPKVYASGIAVNLIKNKLSEFRNVPINLVEYHHDSIYNFEDFEVSFSVLIIVFLIPLELL